MKDVEFQVVQTYNIGSTSDLALSPNGSPLCPLIGLGANIGVFEEPTPKPLTFYPVTAPPAALALSPNGGFIYGANSGGISVLASG
jgi:hypothetical protein